MKKIYPWFQLVRFPNTFALAADVLTVAFLTQFIFGFSSLKMLTSFIAAGCGSLSLYWAGMILNDVYDAEEDAILRSNRPIPSGRIALSTARRVGKFLLLFGIFLFFVPGFLGSGVLPGLIALGVAACVWLYDAVLKNTPMGPFVMGLCRGLNVLALFAFQPFAELVQSPLLLYPLALTLYISGVTFYARCETEDAPEAGVRRPGAAAMLFSVLLLSGGLALLIHFPTQLAAWRPGSVAPLFLTQEWRWPILFVFLMVFLSFRAIEAYFHGPLHVQQVVKQLLFTVFMVDAALVLVACTLSYALGIIALFFAALCVGKWIYST